MATYVTLTVPVEDIIGADYDPRRTAVYIETNTPNSLIVVDGSTIRAGGRREKIGSSGTVQFANLVATNSASNPTSFAYRVQIVYTPVGSREQKVWTSSDFTLTASANLASISEAFDGLAISPTWQSDFRDEMEAIAGLTGEDATIANRIITPGTETKAALDTRYASIAHRPINVREGYGTDNAAVRAALAAAVSGSRELYFAKGTYSLTGDLNTTADGLAISGDGEQTAINFTGGGLILDGTGDYLLRNSMRDLTITRTGTPGPALAAKGHGGYSGVARFDGHNLHLKSTGGEALLWEGSYIAAFHGCYFRESKYGIRLRPETFNTPPANTGVNLVAFFGGEAQENENGVLMEKAAGVNFYGFGIEGNSVTGATVIGRSNGCGWYGCYFEANYGHDIRLAGDAGSGGFVVAGCTFYDESLNKPESIKLERGAAISIYSNHWDTFINPSAVAIRITEATSGAVEGEARNNMRQDGGLLIGYGSTGTPFNSTQVGQSFDAKVKLMLTGNQVLDFPSIPAQSVAVMTVSAPGAELGDDVTLHPFVLPESGLIYQGVVSSAGQITVQLSNITAGAINPGALTWGYRIWR